MLFYSQVEDVLGKNKSGIYVKKEAKANILDNASSHTSAARMYLAAIFTPEAIRNCSLMGKEAKGPLGKPEKRRPGLYRPGLSAALSKCCLWLSSLWKTDNYCLFTIFI